MKTLNITSREFTPSENLSLFLNLRSGVCLIYPQCPDGTYENVFYSIVLEFPIPNTVNLNISDIGAISTELQEILDSAEIQDNVVITAPNSEIIETVQDYIDTL